MIVDDEPTQRFAVTLMCRGLGLPEALTHASAAEALGDIASGRRVDMVVCDLEMPDMDGMEFIRRLAGFDRAPPVMILSGHATPLLDSVERLGRQHGLRMLGSARKPLTRDVLAKAVDSLCQPAAGREDTALPDASEVDALIVAGRFVPHFQPQINMADGRVGGAEVLARLELPDGSTRLPSPFLDRLAERGEMAGFTIDLLDRTIAVVGSWPPELRSLQLSINLSPLLFGDLDLMRQVMDRIDGSGLGRDQVVFELVETAVSQKPMIVAESAARLRLRGFGLSIDDFGQGHATLDQLRRLPFSELKIDRSFVTGIDGDADNQSIVANTISMARALGLRVVAEGVETVAEERMLAGLGCDLAQGFLYARALPPDAFASFVASRNRPEGAGDGARDGDPDGPVIRS